MSNTPNENQMLSDDELLPVSGGTILEVKGQWTTGQSGRPYYQGMIRTETGSQVYGGSNRPEPLPNGRTNYWAMGADGKEYLKGTS